MQVKRNPAVLAGLMGMVALAAPQMAHALSLQEASDFVLASPERPCRGCRLRCGLRRARPLPP